MASGGDASGGPAWKSWIPKMSKTARLVGMAVLAVPAVVWIRKAVSKKSRQSSQEEENNQQENGLSKEEIEQNEKMEAYASQIVASVVSQALEQYQREMERAQ